MPLIERKIVSSGLTLRDIGEPSNPNIIWKNQHN